MDPLDDEEELLLYPDDIPEARGTVPDGLLYDAVDLEELCPDTVALPDDEDDVGRLEAVVLLPKASRTADELLVPNELLLVVVTLLVVVPEELAVTLLPAMTLLPSVWIRDPRYTSLPWSWPGEGCTMW